MHQYDEVEEKLEKMFSDNISVEAPHANDNPIKRKRLRKSIKTKNHKQGKNKVSSQTLTRDTGFNRHQAAQAQVESQSKPKVHKLKCPYVHIKNGKVEVVNFPSNEDECEKANLKPRVPLLKNDKNQLRGMHASTLSSKYDADTADETWLCAFCHNGPHKHRMGDLLGPILIIEPTSLDSIIKSPKRKSEQHKHKKTEVWAHEDCIVSATGVYIIGTKIVGLETAILSSKQHICGTCQNTGATLFCLSRHCTASAHFGCARDQNWDITSNYRYFCPLHNKTEGINNKQNKL